VHWKIFFLRAREILLESSVTLEEFETNNSLCTSRIVWRLEPTQLRGTV
jgi:hypothetical protein